MSSATKAEHKVRSATEIRRGGGFYWYVVECACGWSSKLYASALAANEAYVKHREGADDAS